MEVNRPDLSFITSQNFENFSDYAKWFCNLSDEKQRILQDLIALKIPQLIVCAEMLFDMHRDKPESIVFKIASETLNGK